MNGQILLMGIFNEKLPVGWRVMGDIVALDRGYDGVIKWLLSTGFDIIHTKQRANDFPFTYGDGQKLRGRILIPDTGEMGVYWAKKNMTVPLSLGTGTRKVELWALAFRSGTGRFYSQSTIHNQS